VFVVTAAVAAVVLGAVGAFNLLRVAADRARATILVGQIQVHTPILVAAVFAPLNGRGATPGVTVAGVEAAIDSELLELRDLGVQSSEVAIVTAAAQSLFAAVEAVNSRVAAGDLAGANVLARTRLLDAQAALTAENGSVLDKLDRASRRTTVQRQIGVLGLLIGTAITVATLLVAGDRKRRRAGDMAIARFESLLDSSSDIIIVTGAEGGITYGSPSLYHTLGSKGDAVLLAERIHPDDLPLVRAAMGAIGPSPDDTIRLEARVMHKDGRWLTLECTLTNKLSDTGLNGYLWNGRDISDRKVLEEQLRRQALEDPLTGLPNRVVLRDRLTNALARRARHDRDVGVLLVSLDGFKEINEAAGHEAGDAVLLEIAARMNSVLRAGDTLARVGGDEFAMVIDELADEMIIDEVVARIHAVLQQPIDVATRQFRVSASIGKAMCVGEHGPDEALRHADIAMYAARAAGDGRMVTFEPFMAIQLQDRLALTRDLDEAAASGRLVLHYQPTVDLETGAVQGAEALVRWNHPTRGYLPPLDFIPLAEETGAIVSIGRWVLDTACHQAALWEKDPSMATVQSISVNMSGRQLLDHNIVRDVRAALDASGLTPTRLTIEITESVLMCDTDLVLAQLTALKALGVSLAIDDFGTGYSSLSYLRRFPVDILKIDKSFIDNVAHNGAELTRAIVNMGVSLHMHTVAEGIEDSDQATALRQLGCDVGQGFLFSRPLPAGEFEAVANAVHRQLDNLATEVPA
jgi:diguanylate cyclase (GGDEF)-like protein/PAS domain S-box-containing protein